MKKVEVFLKNIVLKMVLFLTLPPKKNALRQFKNADKILFVRLNRIGDALVSTGFITTVQKATGSTVHVLADEKNSFVYKNVPGVSKVFQYRKQFSERRELMRLLREQTYTVVVDLHDDVSATVSFLIKALKAPYKFGLNKPNAKIFTHTAPKPDAGTVHVIRRIFSLSQLFGINPLPEQMSISFRPSDAAGQKAREFVENRFGSPSFLLGINISAGSDARFWGAANYRALIDALSTYPVEIVMLSTTRDLKHAFRIWDKKDKIFYTPVFEEFAAIMEHIDLLFSPDTATVHLASIYKKPVFGLYVQYNTNDVVWSPFGSDFDMVLTKEETLHNIPSQEVIAKFIPFLEKHLS